MKIQIAQTAAILLAGTITVSSAQAADYTMKIGFATFKDVQHQWSNWMKEAFRAPALAESFLIQSTLLDP